MNHNHHLFDFFMNRELNELYMATALRTFALSMINLFVPIYLIKLGYPLFTVFMYYAILNGTHALLTIPAVKIASKYGFKHTIQFSIPFLILYYAMLHSLDQFGWMLWILPIVYGANNALFWFGYHVDFSKNSTKGSRGTQVSTGRIISSIARVSGPFIGGLILAFAGFKVMFIAVCVILFSSTLPLLRTKDTHEEIKFSMKNAHKGLKFSDFLGFLGLGIEGGAQLVIWRIFLFFVLLKNSFTTLGIVSSVSLLFTLFFNYMAGKFTDKNSSLVLKTGGVINALIWGLRMLIRTSFQVFIVDALYGIAQAFLRVPFNARSYEKASNSKDILKFTLFREFSINGTRSLFFIAMAYTSTMFLSFLYAGTASILFILF